ncbi:MAG: hypothetical protein PHF84_02635 [bacterium]|nr:hypothetical protein [bacterium]
MINLSRLQSVYLSVCLLLSLAAAPLAAEESTNTAGNTVLWTAYQMAFVEKVIIVGSCYDFINAAYTRAGYPPKLRKTVFTSPKKGPYADIDLIQPGDWFMHINLEFNSVEHSGLFVSWVDKERKIAKTLDYAGMNRKEPGKFRDHDLSRVYRIIRPK